MKRCLRNRVLFLASWALLSCAAVAAADNWPSWRGPDANGVSKETRPPAEWSETQNVAWRLALPARGGSTPVVWGDRLFLTSGDGKALVLLCVDATAGKPLWK